MNTNEQENIMSNNPYRYKLIRIPADLRDDFKKEASDTGRKLHEIAESFFNELLEEQWKPWKEDTVHVAVHMDNETLDQLKKVAASCNHNVTSYVRAYHERNKMIHTQSYE